VAVFHCRVNNAKRLISSPVRNLLLSNFDFFGVGWCGDCSFQLTPLAAVISDVRKFSISLLQLSADCEIGFRFVFFSALLHPLNSVTEVSAISCIL
jgi:hypothetical protein